mmetsp:Transcript_16380/g.40435  ORF Transcript_16380/g.40435 Transcript_16380/m.40435 type:complete len:639 (+) Transcript_16380:123-2039(+)|eukprot:CAMPEP_0178996712 /NCGR_PEP_ID=MMETSP0795-20121207/8525_1 /TAXON_ID=88552 /ORGANISM="Amoebophrya sp., Strain Ameob2" /LENGTH=638 /DNA_ID=CAMNT_0020689141 /DNA_START=72 /DNA_END=1988 /DNA_ORIENTATION=-
MIRGGLGDSGQRQSQDCAFEAAKINGTPIRVSYFLVIMFFYQIVGAYQQHAPVWWFPILYAVGTQFLLLATILCHEFGHGLMAKYLGGTIAQILLWPFGGICFSTRPSNILDGRQKIKNELKIVAAGPSTHFLQAPFWVFVLLLQLHFYEVPAEVVSPNDLWYLLIPFSAPPPVPFAYLPGLISQLFWMLACWAVTTNVYLFLFNVFFPMYPMDSAQILVCSLQLCSFSAQFAAKALISVSVPMSVLLLLYAWTNRSQGMMPAITGYLACMCLVEAYNIWKLYKARQLHTHRLFELARSATYFDSVQGARRINVSNLDDAPEEGRSGGRTSSGTNYILFEGQGARLGDAHAGAAGGGDRGEVDRSNPIPAATVAAGVAVPPAGGTSGGYVVQGTPIVSTGAAPGTQGMAVSACTSSAGSEPHQPQAQAQGQPPQPAVGVPVLSTGRAVDLSPQKSYAAVPMDGQSSQRQPGQYFAAPPGASNAGTAPNPGYPASTALTPASAPAVVPSPMYSLSPHAQIAAPQAGSAIPAPSLQHQSPPFIQTTSVQLPHALSPTPHTPQTPPNTGGFAALAQRDRAAFLSRVEQNQQQRNMTVRQLNEVREQQGSGGGGVVGQAANSGRRYVQAEPRWSKTGPDPPV